MSFANVLVRVLLQSDWRLSSKAQLDEYREILKLFADSPTAPLSIQNIAQTGTELDIAVGQWFGPTTISHVLRRLVSQKLTPEHKIAVYVAQDGVICDSDVVASSNNWTMNVVLFVPLRLGLDALNQPLAAEAAHTLQWPQSAGILGGKPRSSYYFVGTHGDYLLYIDPHYSQPVVNMVDQFSIDTFHSHVLHRMRVSDLDPSLALAFLCKSQSDFDDLKTRAEGQGKQGGELFVFMQDRPVDVAASSEPQETEQANDASNADEWDLV